MYIIRPGLNSALWLMLVIVFLNACKEKEPLAIGISDGTSTDLFYVDTFSVDLSTVLINQLPTSNTTRLLSGNLDLGNTGSLNASAYFQLSLKGNDTDGDGNENILTYTGTPVFDSLILILENNYIYGDEKATQNISVHRLTQSMGESGGQSYLYNSSSFTYDNSALGTKSFIYNADNAEIRIPMSTSFAKELFSMALQNDARILTNPAFKDYFKGLVLVSPTSDQVTVGFELNPVMRLYYHDSEFPHIQLSYDFAFNSSTDIYFNRIINDRTATLLSGLKETYQEISSLKTNNESYLLTGVELMPKIKFPTLKSLRNRFPMMTVNLAQLIIQPKTKSYDQNYYLPDRLVLYSTNNTNKPDSVVTFFTTGAAQIITPLADLESDELTAYKFNVTEFARKQLESTTHDDAALLLASLQNESGGRAERLILENNYNQKYRIKLKLYVTNFNL